MASGHEVGIVGYAGRLPGAGSTRAFWRLLRDNVSSVSWITPDRFPTDAFYHPSKDQPGRSYTFAAGLIDDVWGFDGAAFGMSPREAEQVDPQQRQLLEVMHDALAHAGIRASSLAGTSTGVYVGASSLDYGARFFADPSSADVHMMTGNTLSILSNRLSYNLDVHGPSFTVDTACSSSLVALSLAADAIRAGTVDTAIVAGVNLLLSPFSFVGFSRASMLSPTGRCRPFDSAADGYVRAEGAIVLVLRSVEAARRARNRIHATLAGWGVGQDGRTTGMSLPSAESQRQLLEQVYGDFGVDPAELSFIEAHGTGTRVGDPIEADALGKALGQHRSRPLPIGSVKSNIGHLEPASGLAGVLKTLLALNHGVVPATLHQQERSPDIPFDDLNLRVIDRNWQMPERRGPSLAGVNSFGFGGTNAHVVLRGEDPTVAMAHPRGDLPPPPMLISAHSADMLPAVARRHLEAWPDDRRLVADYVAAAAHQRDPLAHRAIVRGDTPETLRTALERFATEESTASVLTGQAIRQQAPVAFVFSGNGSQWAGMGRAAWRTSPRFREALSEIDTLFIERHKASPVELMFADDLATELRRATCAQPLLLALQMATVRALEAHGLVPQAALGHSVGEIAAAWCTGALSTEQAIDVVIARSRHQEVVRGSGTMAAVMLGEREARRFLASAGLKDVDVAAINSWRSVTVSGPTDEIDRMLTQAGKQRIGARRLNLDYPFHSRLIDPVRAPLLRDLERLRPRATRKLFVSTVTGEVADGTTLDAGYWWRNVREPVQFEAGLNRLIADGYGVFVEVGPRPILGSYLRDVLREADQRGAIIETLEESEDETNDALERTVSRVAIAGGTVDRQRLFGPPPVQSVPMPGYPWRHTSYRVQPTAEASGVFLPPVNVLLGTRARADVWEWFSTVDTALHPWIKDHAVGGIPVFPAAAYVEVLLAAAREVHGEGPLELREMDILRPLAFDGVTSFETQTRVSLETGIAEFLARPRHAGIEWSLYARGIVGRSSQAEGRPTDLQDTGTIVVPRPLVYKAAEALGFGYGDAFQRLSHVSFPHPKRAFGVLNEQPGVALDGQVADITGIDAAFHALFATEEAGVADMPMKRMLPVRFGRVRAYAPGKMASYAVCRTLRQSLTSILAQIDLSDEDGRAVMSLEMVRLVEAPVAPAIDARGLMYRLERRRLARPGDPSGLVVHEGDLNRAVDAIADLEEAQLLLEAGCLRAAWEAFRGDGDRSAAVRRGSVPDGTEATQPAYLRASLLWHLETKGLASVRDDGLVPADNCSLPALGSLVRTLVSRFPTMAQEAAALARIGEFTGGFFGHGQAAGALETVQWRSLEAASQQVAQLRGAVLGVLRAALSRSPSDRLVRLLAIGAEHTPELADTVAAFPHVEVVVTDIDPARIEQAQAALGDSARRLRFVPWTELVETSGATFDIAVAVDSLSELAADGEGLDRLRRLMRPQADLVAGELGPSIFWDIIRGMRPTWWLRSANIDFPVGPLLTVQEWSDELAAAGFSSAGSRTFPGEPSLGVLIKAQVGRSIGHLAAPRVRQGFRWDGDRTPAALSLQRQLVAHEEVDQAPARPGTAPVATPLAWVIDIDRPDLAAAGTLTDLLVELSARCAELVASATPLWVVLASRATTGDESLDRHPVWRAVTAALRVAQNEFPAMEIRCLGLADDTAETIAAATLEMSAPDAEREVLILAGERSVFRIEPGPPNLPSVQVDTSAATWYLAPRAGTSRGNLVWARRDRTAPGPNEVEIEVAATGLNFRDVMWNLGLLPEEALEDGYSGPRLGMESTGIVSAVGEAVTDFTPGDRVAAFVSGGFARHVVVPSFAVSRLSSNLGFDAAATLPVAYLTAHYALTHLANLRRGETVLVHGGAGAVGLAALAIARAAGARVIATAGSEEKRALLRQLGAEAALNSRTLSFADEVRTLTDGVGVDVVLNSLFGEAMIRSMECLRPFGRFVELGKRDFYANTHIGLRPFRRNLSYFGVDVDQLIGEHQQLTQQLFAELMAMFASGELPPLPHRVFAGEHIDDAFRLMQRSGHIGKIVVKPAAAPTEAPEIENRFPVDAEAIHLVVGGTGGFGLAAAEWLVGRGARHLVLASRTGMVPAEAVDRVERLRQDGVLVTVARVDVTDAAATTRLVRNLAGQRRLGGIVHAAMVLDDRLMDGMDREAILRVMQPKVDGALNLATAVDGLTPDYLLFFSSATTFLGNPGQYNYVAANGFLEGLACRLRSRGIPALAVAWGAIEDTGYLARHMSTNASLRKRFSSSLLPARTALDALDRAWTEGTDGTASLAIARIDWAATRRDLAVARSPSYVAVVPAAGARNSASAAIDLEKLKTMSIDEASEVMLEIVVEEIAKVLRLATREVDKHRPLAEIGMDSLMMLELRNTVEETLQIELPLMSLANGITPADVARRIAGLVVGDQRATDIKGSVAAAGASHLTEEIDTVDLEQQEAAARAVLERANRLDGPL